MRSYNRENNELRPVSFETTFTKNPDGSVLVATGETRVLCTATIEENLPPFLKNKDVPQGWVTAEYSLLPGSTHTRFRRERGSRAVSGRTQEIQRLIGRSLRAVVDMVLLGPRQIVIDCDVLQADGGTRTASINGAFVALVIAVDKLMSKKLIKRSPIKSNVAAISCGISRSAILLDLDYKEDSSADVDMNIVMNSTGAFLEVQGTAENKPFTGEQLNEVLRVSQSAIESIIECQNEAIRKHREQ